MTLCVCDSDSLSSESGDGRLGVPVVLGQVVGLVGQHGEVRRPGVGVLHGDDDGSLC